MQEPVRALVCGYAPEVRRRKLLMAVGYMDDSGSEQSKPDCVVAGFVATVELWEPFSLEWEKVLRESPSIEYFKLSEARSRKNQFDKSRWCQKEINEKLIALAQVIARAKPLLLDAVVPWDDYKRIVTGKVSSQIDHPFFVGFHTVIRKMAQARRKGSYHDVVDFIFDEGSPFADQALTFYRKLIEAARLREDTALLDCLGATPVFRDDKKVLPLQAADLVAGHIRGHLDSTLPPSTEPGYVGPVMELLEKLRTDEFDVLMGDVELSDYLNYLRP